MKGGWVMNSFIKGAEMFLMLGLILASFVFSPLPASGQVYPNKPITVYCGYAPGATTDLTTRALAAGAEKILGVPFIVENKPGAGATVAPALLARQKPDGYTIQGGTSGALVSRPHLLKLGYDPLKDFTYLVQFSRYIGGLCVNGDSPLKSIDEFIAYAKVHPGLSYGSSGTYTQQQIAVELLAKCKGLTFKHVSTKGGAEFNTLLLGRHTDFVAGSGSHIPYVKQGVFRMLLVFNQDERDPNYPDIPTLKELGCGDVPANSYIFIGPKGMPPAISQKLVDTFKKVIEGPDFRKLLANNNLPYDFKDQAQLEKIIPAQYEWYKNYFKEAGVLK
jgi:tripartite-type tricarboxylate transporter receptor subunit TctC